MVEEVKRHTFAQVRNQTHFSIVDLAHNAGVGTVAVYKMLLNQPVEHPHAMAVLHVLSVMYSADYSLDTVDVALCEQEDGQLL